MAYIGWANNVNKKILDSTGVTVGEGAAVTTKVEKGRKRTRLSMSNAPDKFSVTMSFCYLNNKRYNSVTKQYEDCENELSELDRFYTWLKYYHKFGTNPFQFPSIIISSHQKEAGRDTTEWYKITSATQGKKSGEHMSITMTWETDINGIINVVNPDKAVSDIIVEGIVGTTGRVKLLFDEIPVLEPTTEDYYIWFYPESKVEYDEAGNADLSNVLSKPDLYRCTTKIVRYENSNDLIIYFEIPEESPEQANAFSVISKDGKVINKTPAIITRG